MIILKSFKKTTIQNGLRLSLEVAIDDSIQELWYEIYGVKSKDLLNNQNYAAIGILMPAMLANKNLKINGSLSKNLHYYLNNDIQDLLIGLDPHLNKIKVIANHIVDDLRNCSGKVASPFSGGVDSFATYLMHSKSTNQPFLITDLVCFNVGAFGDTLIPETEKIFNRSVKQLKYFCQKVNLNPISISTNLDLFYKLPLHFLNTVLMRNTSCAMCLDGYLDNYLYPSTYAFNHVVNTPIKKISDISLLDPFILPLLSSDHLSFHSSGMCLSRFKKTRFIALSDLPESYLNVCVLPVKKRLIYKKINCGICFKCHRTLVSIELLSALDRYGRVFNLNRYRSNRFYIYSGVISRSIFGEISDKEILGKLCKKFPAELAFSILFVPIYLFKNYLYFLKLLIKKNTILMIIFIRIYKILPKKLIKK